jgi:hypothetical protein
MGREAAAMRVETDQGRLQASGSIIDDVPTVAEIPIMLAYVISFYKRLCDSTGHRFRPKQGEVLVRDEPDESGAIRKAKRSFAHDKGVTDWRIRASEVEVRRVGEGEPLP